jgi:gliding motility-associated-like protein
MLWGQFVTADCVNNGVEFLITDVGTIQKVTLVFQGETDTTTYQYPFLKENSFGEWEVSTTLDPSKIGYYVIKIDGGLPLLVFYYGCNVVPDCGEYIHISGVDSINLSVNTDTVKELRIDFQAHSIVDTIEILYGGNSILKLGVGGYADGPLGPLVWQDGNLITYKDSLDRFPYFNNLGVKFKNNTDGLAVFFLMVPDTVCDVRVTVWSNNNSQTVWDLFVHCTERVDKVNPRDTLSFILCEPGLVEGTFISKDTSWFRIRKNDTGCTYHEDIMVEVVKKPVIEFNIDKVSCDDQPLKLIITHDDDRELAVSVAGQKKILSHDETWDMSNLSVIGKNHIQIEVVVEGCVYTNSLQYARWNCGIYFPNAFSPNNDGINDVFYPFTGAEDIRILELAVYDRWGNWLFHKLDFLPNDPTRGWDGTFRGKDLDAGVYVWWANVLLPSGTRQLFKGDVTLIK